LIGGRREWKLLPLEGVPESTADGPKPPFADNNAPSFPLVLGGTRTLASHWGGFPTCGGKSYFWMDTSSAILDHRTCRTR
ncbi:hypothetical protein AVEN_212584-2-1, partial [Araneus ventricosus]